MRVIVKTSRNDILSIKISIYAQQTSNVHISFIFERKGPLCDFVYRNNKQS